MYSRKKTVLAAALLFAAVLCAFALPANWTLYIPGALNASDPKADLEAAGFRTMPLFSEHFSFVSNTANGKKALKFDTTKDGKNDVIMYPLSGNEKRVTLIFKARGSVQPDAAPTPFGIFWASFQKGPYQAVLRHNASNQIKGSSGQSALKPDDIVSEWTDFRFVFEVADDGKTMTATAFVNGRQRHQTKDYVKDVSGDATAEFDTEKFMGLGNYLLFGDNDGSTSGFGRYAYFLIVRDDDVSQRSLGDLSKDAGFDLAVTPVTEKDPNPPSRRPAQKPAGINMTAKDAGSKDAAYADPAAVIDGKINLDALPFSKNAVQKVNRAPVLPKAKFAATVDRSGKGTHKTIAAAIDAVRPGSAILVKAGLYNEKLTIKKAGITLVGENPATTVIYGYEADTGGIDGNVLVNVDLSAANGASFCAENITFYNKGAQWNRTWGAVERRSVTLAARSVQEGYVKNCVFLGEQDTMYLRSGRLYFQDCYIEGEVDFICGGATVLFDNCHVHSIYYANGGYVAAAAPADTNGYGFENGYVFRSCLFTADEKYKSQAKKIFLGRGSWNGGSSGGSNPAKVVIMDSALENHLDPAGWQDWDSVSTVAKAFFREYNNSGTYAVSSDTGLRKLLTADEYGANYASAEKILGFAPKMKY